MVGVKTYEQTHATPVPTPETTLRPSGQYTILAGKSAGSEIITSAATAPTANVFSQTVVNAPQFFNGTYWYYTPLVSQLNNLGSIGFSESQVIDQNSADVQDLVNNTKLSWHITHVTTGGYRLGS
jgi:hypothetical protein